MRESKFRSVFLSDLHLGFRLSNAKACSKFLCSIHAENVFLVGDTIDGWRLARRWHWPEAHDRVMDGVIELQKQGSVISLLSGNHDDFLRELQAEQHGDTPLVRRIRDEIGDKLFRFPPQEFLIHKTAAGKKLFVAHGDLFDDVEKRSKGLSVWGSHVFDRFSWILPNSWCHQIRRFFKWIMAKPDAIRAKIIEAAKQHGCDGVIYGHIHNPILEMDDGLIIGNTGDWVQNESFLVEHFDGSLELVNFGTSVSRL